MQMFCQLYIYGKLAEEGLEGKDHTYLLHGAESFLRS